MHNFEAPSVQWHLAQMLFMLPLDGNSRRRAIAILMRNLQKYDDWIVENLTLEVLAVFARQSPSLHYEMLELLSEYTENARKSVASRPWRILARLHDTQRR